MKRQQFLAGALAPIALARAASAGAQPADADPAAVTIAYQEGLAYAPLVIMKERRTLERAFPHTKITWTTLSGGSAVRDGIIADQLQLGAAGTAPFLIGWSHNPAFRILCGISTFDIWLVAKDPAIKTLRDIAPGMKIGTPDLAGSNMIILQLAAERTFGNLHHFDSNVQVMPHSLAMQALATGAIAAHFSSPPFQFEEVAAGAHVVLRSVDVVGPATFTALLTTDRFAHRHPRFTTAVFDGTADGVRMAKANPAEAARLLLRSSGARVPEAKMQSWLMRKATTYDTTPHAVLAFARFMKAQGEIAAAPASLDEVTLPVLRNKGD